MLKLFYNFNKFSKSRAQTWNIFLVKIQDSLSSEFLTGVFGEGNAIKGRKEGLLPPLRSALDHC